MNVNLELFCAKPRKTLSAPIGERHHDFYLLRRSHLGSSLSLVRYRALAAILQVRGLRVKREGRDPRFESLYQGA